MRCNNGSMMRYRTALGTAAIGIWIFATGLSGCGRDGETVTTALEVSAALNPNPATLMVGALPLVSLILTPAKVVLSQDSTQQFVAIGTYADGSQQGRTGEVTWTSSDDKLATISNDRGSAGVVTARNFGVVTIFATLNRVSANAALTLN